VAPAPSPPLRPEHPDNEVATILARLDDRGIPLLAVGGFQHGQLVASSVSIEKAGRIYAKDAGFDDAVLGTRSGAHFAVVMYGTLAAAYDRNVRIVEYGVGAHQAKALRGCQPCTITSYLLPDQPRVRDIVTTAAALNAPHWRADTPARKHADASSRHQRCGTGAVQHHHLLQ
jgi:predicted N-acyltransferase